MKIFYSNGVAGDDKDSPEQPVQGLSLAVFEKHDVTGDWTAVQRGPDGEPYFGYKAKQLTNEEAELWKTRIDQAALAGPDGYKDDGGVWYPGRIGRGRSVIDAAGWKQLLKLDAERVVAAEKRLMKSLEPVYQLAKSVADTSNQDVSAVLKAFRPDLSDTVVAKLLKVKR